MTEPNTKSIGFIGCGETARFHAEVLTSLNIKISCVFATNQKSKNIEGFANDFHIEKKYFDIDQMFLNEKLDAVWVVVPWNITYKVLKQIRKYNVPIFVEKPVATSKLQVEELIDLYKDFGSHLQVGFNRRFYDFMPQLKESLINKKIKSVIIEAPESSSEDDMFNLNMIHINTSHLIDLVLFLFDSLEFKSSWIMDKKNYSALLIAKKNIPVHFISSWDTNSNFSIKISTEDEVFHLKPLEKLTIYDSMKVTTLSNDSKIRSYIPNIKSEYYCDDNFKPGFLQQASYFIDKIEEGCKADDNNSFKSNIIGGMTNYKFFINDIEFLKLIWQIFDIVDKDVKKEIYSLSNAWGLRNGLSHFTKHHNHIGCFFSGVIYLNKHPQILEFPEINKTVEPDVGSFAVFSSFLNHYCKRNLDNQVKYGMSFNCNYGHDS